MMHNCGMGKARVKKVILYSGEIGETSVRFILVLRLKRIRLSCCNTAVFFLVGKDNVATNEL